MDTHLAQDVRILWLLRRRRLQQAEQALVQLLPLRIHPAAGENQGHGEWSETNERSARVQNATIDACQSALQAGVGKQRQDALVFRQACQADHTSTIHRKNFEQLSKLVDPFYASGANGQFEGLQGAIDVSVCSLVELLVQVAAG